MPKTFYVNIDIVNKVIVNANIFILALLLLAFSYKWFNHHTKVK
jgi:hypothetical protein